MRRPRGPGGRFLTAEEMAAQKLPPLDHPNDEDMDDDDAIDVPSPVAAAEGDPFLNQPPDPMPPIYHLHQPPSPSTTKTATLYAQRQSPANSASVTLSAPYSTVQMHHVPHPHAHARHHHSNIAYSQHHGIYNGPESDSGPNGVEMQRRAEEIIQFGTAGGS